MFKIMERVMRIELTTSVWKTEVLPLNYTRIIKFLILSVSSRLKLFYHFQKSLSRTFFIFFKSFFRSSTSFLRLYYFIIINFFCQEFFKKFLTFVFDKCLIVRLLYQKTFIILSSLIHYVNRK